jgi:hypothetical protein
VDVLLTLDDVDPLALADGLQDTRKPVEHPPGAVQPPGAIREPLREALTLEAHDLEQRLAFLV